MMKLRISTSGNHSNQLEGKPIAENAVVLNTFQRYIRRRHCSACNENNSCCGKMEQGLSELSHESQEHRRSENISPGELAGVYFTIAEVSRVLRPVNKVKLPHMFHDQLKWIVHGP